MPIDQSNPPIRIYLVGTPNSGKSTLFNQLTGLNQKTGNFPGVTVEKKSGFIETKPNQWTELWDLPGVLGFSGNSEEKKITIQTILSAKPNEKILYVLDATQLERSLLFLFSIIEKGLPVFIALTMTDILEKRGFRIDIKELEKILGIPILIVNPKKREGVDDLKQKLCDLENFQRGIPLGEKNSEDLLQDYTKKFQSIKKILSKILLPIPGSLNEKPKTLNKIDNYLLHPILGLLVFFIVIALIFQFLFTWSQWPMEQIENFVSYLQNLLSHSLPEGPLSSLLVDGVIGGVGAILAFLPQIALLFFFIGLMEESGYLSRASFVMDKLMGKFGLSGSAFIPLISSAACAVPAILGTRTIESKPERMTTILVAPLIMCSARYPVYILIVGTVFYYEPFQGVISLKGLVLFCMFLLGIFSSFLLALVFRKTVFRSTQNFFILELPDYRVPSLKVILQKVWVKIVYFLSSAGRIILSISIILWFLSYYPIQTDSAGERVINIENSYAGKLGKVLEPMIQPLGFNWKIGVAILTSFAAREVMVSTLAVIYGLEGESEESNTLQETMRKDRKENGKLVWNIPTGLSLLVFYAFAHQCMSTLAVVRRETNSWLWPMVQFLYMTGLAYILSFLVYQITSIILD